MLFVAADGQEPISVGANTPNDPGCHPRRDTFVGDGSPPLARTNGKA